MTGPSHERLRKVFHEVIRLPASQREHELETICNGDSDLIRAVKHLLDYHRTTTILPNDNQATVAIDPRSSTATEKRSSVSRAWGDRISMVMSSKFLRSQRKRFWAVLTTSMLLLLLFTLVIEATIRRHLRQETSGTLSAILNEQFLAIEFWLDAEFRVYQKWAGNDRFLETTEELLQTVTTAQSPAEFTAAGDQLRWVLKDLSSDDPDLRFAMWSRDFQLVADSDRTSTFLGNSTTDFGTELLGKVLLGRPMLWMPTPRGFITQGYAGDPVHTKPNIALLLPVRRGKNRSLAVLMIAGMKLQERLEEILQRSRYSTRSESYLIDANGNLVTESRFNSTLIDAGLIQGGPDAFSAQQVQVSEPGGNLEEGFMPDLSERQTWPLTKAARLVTRKTDGLDVDGYLDYRGVEVVGAWKWSERYGFGLIFENDKDVAYQTLMPLRLPYAAMLSVVGIILVASMWRWRKDRARERLLGIAGQIGPYHIMRSIGEGGMAEVYLAQHDLLKRPTALKLLKKDQLTPENVERFKREVQLASRLTHPNTIEIYDYGLTPSGEFYCAMEFICGFNLQALIEVEGALPSDRVIHILEGLCRSLNEAHTVGMVHRDVKLQNLMIAMLGGEPDFVKVLDFGLAKETASDRPLMTQTQVLVGTPMYIAPERIADPTRLDPRSDIFSLGIVGFILLTGREPHSSSNSIDALMQTMREDAIPPSKFLSVEIQPELDELICQCQARDPKCRPQTVAEVLERLRKIPRRNNWTTANALKWWKDFGPTVPERDE